jgi:hypothetical protein
MAGRLTATAGVGLGLILTGIAWFGGWGWWENTRIWKPLDVPVSLSVGQIRTVEFKINVESTYSIGIAVEQSLDWEETRCVLGIDQCQGNPSALRASWSISRAGRVTVRGVSDTEQGIFWADEGRGRVLGTFHANSGRYILELSLLQDASRLNARAPYLVIFETGGERERAYDVGWYAFMTMLLSLPVGISALVRSGIVRRADKQDAFLRAWPLSQPGPQPPIPGIARPRSGNVELRHHRELRPWSAWPFSRTSWYGLIGTHTYPIMLIPVWVMISGMVPTGLVVHLVKPGIAAQSTPGIQPLRVCVGAAPGDVHPKLYVDSRLVAWEDFAAVLQKELSQRPPNWPVYVEGSRDVEWGHAVRAIDVIRGLQAQVVLLTPSTKSGREPSASKSAVAVRRASP